MSRRLTGFLMMLYSFLLILVGLLNWNPVTAAELTVYADSTGIWIVSGAPEFGMINMAPGDSVATTLHIINDSTKKYSLGISADVAEGDKLLYDGLVISIGDTCFAPLSKLQRVELGSFAAGSKQSYSMRVALPPEAGNRYQDCAVTVKFQILQLNKQPAPEYPPDAPVPDNPGKPVGASWPDAPGVPDAPDVPDEPVAPDVPDTPEGPDAPDAPDGPDAPGAPDSPDAPDTPVQELPVRGSKGDWLLPLGLILFLMGLLLARSARKEQKVM